MVEAGNCLWTHESTGSRFCPSRACRVAGAVLFAVVWSIACHGDLHDAAKTRDIYSAARYGDLRTARALLKDHPDLAFSKDLNGRTALQWAAANRQLAVVELLLAYHADANARSASRTTPLHEAAGAGDKEVAELLLTHSADINARDKSGGTPLHWAVLTDRRGVAEVLLARHLQSMPKRLSAIRLCKWRRVWAMRKWQNFSWQTRHLSIPSPMTVPRLCIRPWPRETSVWRSCCANTGDGNKSRMNKTQLCKPDTRGEDLADRCFRAG